MNDSQDTAATLAAPQPTSEPTQYNQGDRLERAELLLEISHEVAALDSLDDILASLVKITTRELSAERGTFFLNDPRSHELYSRVAQGNLQHEIRVLNDSGIVGFVFQNDCSEIVPDAYADARFNTEVDERTDFQTRNILCSPLRTVRGEVIGVTQLLNKIDGHFTAEDLTLLEAIATQASMAIQSSQLIEQMQRNTVQEMEFLDMIADITSEIDIGQLLQQVMQEATRMLEAERSSLFMNDEKTNELWMYVGEGLTTEIRLPNTAGIAGAVFTSGETINIPHAYADLRFNPEFDKQTNFFTSSILCIPVVNKSGKTIGVTQVLNKRGGPFNEDDEQRLKAFTAQVSIALENATLFSEVQRMQNYNETILESMPNGMLTFDDERKLKTVNQHALDILQITDQSINNCTIEDLFADKNSWIVDKINIAGKSMQLQHVADAELLHSSGLISVNASFQPLVNENEEKIGSLIMLEDISTEKRMKSMMSRYMDASLADQLMEGEEDSLGGTMANATVLFSDIRGFTTLTEKLGAQGTVTLLNEYFTLMVECLQKEGGMLDKFIGDAIMAGFGIPKSHGNDEDRAVRTAVEMIRELWKWNDLRGVNGQGRVGIGIGLNTDSVVTGNIGSLKRMDYTMIGDGVNLAARLESACKQYRTRILVSDNTYTKLRGTYRSRQVDLVLVKGKSQPVKIHEILDYHTEESFPNIQEALNFFKGGRDEYNKQQWDRAIDNFSETVALNPRDHLSRIYIERCQYMKTHPPGDDWDGIWVMESK
ncbi:MAG: GAF domain-containing protein [Pseudomonadales bacterium]|nr:GAF domain-containing protein [Pseudomonadales bacterium]